jgi:cystathionine gamma-synthase
MRGVESPEDGRPDAERPGAERPDTPSAPAGAMGEGTASVWAGEETPFDHGSTVVPVMHGVTYAFDDLDAWEAVALGERPGHIYSRNTNPTVAVFEEKIRLLERAEASTAFSTGMAAISNTLFALLAPGDRVVAPRDSYGGTNRIFIEFLPRIGVEVALCDTTDFDAIEAEVAKGCALLYLETPTNPTLKVMDLRRLARAGKAAGATVVVDNTFATPINQRPLELGADLVIHSATKYLGGHSDAMGGALCGDRARVRKVFQYREINGATLHPMAAFLLVRGMKTLELRVLRQNENALRIARFLDGHPGVEAVHYPGLPDDPGHAVARGQMHGGFGGMLSFVLGGGPERMAPFLRSLRFAHRAASLGSVGTLVGPPRTTSHVELTREERARAGIPENLVRYSVGIENADDLVRDLETALEGGRTGP